MRVLVVDDSVVFRSQIKASLEGVPSIEVVGTANNGRIALQKLAQTSVDLITLDMEMPEMGGLETIKEIKKNQFKCRIIVFSSHTTRGSQAALEALAAGADDFCSKPSGEALSVETGANSIRQELLPKIMQFIDPTLRTTQPTSSATSSDFALTEKPKVSYFKKELDTFLPKCILIGSSTGGPPALEKVFVDMPKNLRCPIFIAQHMPPVFTHSLAQRLAKITNLTVKEGEDQEVVQPNTIYIAPGDFHMKVKKEGTALKISLDKNPLRNSVRPAVDYLFESAVEVFGPSILGIILTGMGEDGLMGCKAIKNASGGVLIQNKETCVVFGMPGAVYQEGCFDEDANLERINSVLKRMVR